MPRASRSGAALEGAAVWVPATAGSAPAAGLVVCAKAGPPINSATAYNAVFIHSSCSGKGLNARETIFLHGAQSSAAAPGLTVRPVSDSSDLALDPTAEIR